MSTHEYFLLSKVLSTYLSTFIKRVLCTYSSTLKTTSTHYLLEYFSSVLASCLFQSGGFSFQPTCTDHVSKIIDKLSIKKATGVDKISVKILKESFVPHFKDLINLTINTYTFPDKIKLGQVAPIFKKNDPLVKSNYRPVSILPVRSKIYEKVLSEQLSNYFESIFDDYLCAFRKRHGCQTTLMRLLEDWRKAFGSNHYIAAVLADLSKAFDCLPHDILLCKLECYGLS